jgi:hypothetical protein
MVLDSAGHLANDPGYHLHVLHFYPGHVLRGCVNGGGMADLEVVTTTESPVSEEDRQIEGYHKALHSLFKGCDDIIVAQSVATFMGCHMAHTDDWKRIIPGFVKEMLEFANLSMAAHRQAESIAQPDLNQLGAARGEKSNS